VVKLLLEKGAKLKSKDEEYDRTPLLLAVASGHETIIKLLLKRGVKLKFKEEYD
jgi:ankyrin repeat protein